MMQNGPQSNDSLTSAAYAVCCEALSLIRSGGFS